MGFSRQEHWSGSPFTSPKERKKVKLLSHVQLFVTPWTVAYQAPPSMEFFRQEYWSGLPFPSPGIFLTQGYNPGLPHYRQTLYRLSPQGRAKYLIIVPSYLKNTLIYQLLMPSHVQLFTIPWTVACQAPLSMKFSRQEYWSGLAISFSLQYPHLTNEET